MYLWSAKSTEDKRTLATVLNNSKDASNKDARNSKDASTLRTPAMPGTSRDTGRRRGKQQQGHQQQQKSPQQQAGTTVETTLETRVGIKKPTQKKPPKKTQKNPPKKTH